MPVRARSALGLAFVVFATVAGRLASGDAEVLSEGAEGRLPVTAEMRLEITELRGTIVLRAGKSEELRYQAASLDEARTAEPVTLVRLPSGKLRLRAPDGRADRPLLLELAVPATVGLEVALEHSEVHASGLLGPLSVSGNALTVELRGVKGVIEADCTNGTLEVSDTQESVFVKGEKLRVDLQRIGGSVQLNLGNSELQVRQAVRGLFGTLLATRSLVAGIQAPVRLEVEDGELHLDTLLAGGDVRLAGTPLTVTGSAGILRVVTDARTDVKSYRGRLEVKITDAMITGEAIADQLVIEGESAQITLTGMGGTSQIRGEDLTIHVHNSQGALDIRTASSSILIEEVAGPVVIDNEFGDVSVHNASQPVQLTSRNGEVRATELKAPLQLKADGREVHVSWTELAGEQDSSIENASGNVRVSFPAGVRCRVQAEAPNGRIETGLPGLTVSDEGSVASGALNQGTRPTVAIKSGGDLYLEGS